MPIIHHGSISKGKPNTTIKTEESDGDDSEPEWLARTNVILTPGSRTIGLQAQSSPMKAVLRSSFKIGTRKMISETRYSPLADDGLDVIAANALVDAADELGYGGEGDISDRLVHDNLEYSQPLRDYVSLFHRFLVSRLTNIQQCVHRISTDRNLIKKTASAIVARQFSGVLNAGPLQIQDMINQNLYIFPKTNVCELHCTNLTSDFFLYRECTTNRNHSAIPRSNSFSQHAARTYSSYQPPSISNRLCLLPRVSWNSRTRWLHSLQRRYGYCL